MTWAGGIVGAPMAFFNRESTTTIRVKEVVITRMVGARESTVKSTNNWTPVLTCLGVPPESTESVTPGASSWLLPTQLESNKLDINSIKRIIERLDRIAGIPLQFLILKGSGVSPHGTLAGLQL